MKNLFLILLLAVFISCNSQIGFKQVDHRAPTEIALIKQFVDADSAYNAQINNVNKDDSHAKSNIKITDFILNKLHSKVDNWEVSIQSIDHGVNGIDVSFLISKKADFEDQNYDTSECIALKADEITDTRLVTILKTLQPDDKVLITGNITTQKDITGVLPLEVLLYTTIDKEEELRSPSFDFNLTDIKKKEVQKL